MLMVLNIPARYLLVILVSISGKIFDTGEIMPEFRDLVCEPFHEPVILPAGTGKIYQIKNPTISSPSPPLSRPRHIRRGLLPLKKELNYSYD
jgi:hypothetical protein